MFRGVSVGAARDVLGEVVFNTGMTGYQEILTDPSYSGQIVTMTYTEIGNTGINIDDMEARRAFANGFVVHELTEPRNWRSQMPLSQYFVEQDVPAISGIDTRALTCKLRTQGTLKAFLCVTGSVDEKQAVQKACAWEGLTGQDYAARVTCGETFQWDPPGAVSTSWGLEMDVADLPKPTFNVVAFDFGIKWNILRRMRQHGMAVTVVPAHTPAEEALALKPDGVFLSNGPADPAAVTYAIDTARALIGKVPLMGICLGHQILGLAMGGSTYRLKFGHHGLNHPVMDLATREVEITSQNHNFAIDQESLDAGTVDVTHVNLNDDTVEGLRHRREPLFCVQYHPEASPGPHDAGYLFERFQKLMTEA